jgi:hypothetical protein
MSHDIETVLVHVLDHKNQDETFLINKRDFDEKKHKLFGAQAANENEFLKRNASDIIADLPALTPEELAEARADELAGKGRAGVIAAIDKEIESRKGE